MELFIAGAVAGTLFFWVGYLIFRDPKPNQMAWYLPPSFPAHYSLSRNEWVYGPCQETYNDAYKRREIEAQLRYIKMELSDIRSYIYQRGGNIK